MHIKIAPILLFRGVESHSPTKGLKNMSRSFLAYRWFLLVFGDVV